MMKIKFYSQRKYRLFVAGVILALVSLACNFGLKSVQPSPTPIPVTTQAVQQLQATVQEAQATAQTSGEVNLSINESQLTSLIAFELQNSGDQSIRNLQVHLQDGQVQLNADVNQQGLSLPASINLVPQLVGDGQLQLHVVSANVGPLPLPGNLTQELETGLNQAFTQEINTLAPNTKIEQITIENGVMTIIGHQR